MDTDNFIIENSKDFYQRCNSCKYSNSCQFKSFLKQVVNSGITEDLKSSNFYKDIHNMYNTHNYGSNTFSAICGVQKD